MAKAKSETSKPRKLRPVLTPEARENRLISLAIDRAEEQLLNGTASSQVITHYLKLGTVKATLENEKLREENELLRAKTKSLASNERSEEFYQKVIDAMKTYSGKGDSDDY